MILHSFLYTEVSPKSLIKDGDWRKYQNFKSTRKFKSMEHVEATSIIDALWGCNEDTMQLHDFEFLQEKQGIAQSSYKQLRDYDKNLNGFLEENTTLLEHVESTTLMHYLHDLKLNDRFTTCREDGSIVPDLQRGSGSTWIMTIEDRVVAHIGEVLKHKNPYLGNFKSVCVTMFPTQLQELKKLRASKKYKEYTSNLRKRNIVKSVLKKTPKKKVKKSEVTDESDSQVVAEMNAQGFRDDIHTRVQQTRNQNHNSRAHMASTHPQQQRTELTKLIGATHCQLGALSASAQRKRGFKQVSQQVSTRKKKRLKVQRKKVAEDQQLVNATEQVLVDAAGNLSMQHTRRSDNQRRAKIKSKTRKQHFADHMASGGDAGAKRHAVRESPAAREAPQKDKTSDSTTEPKLCGYQLGSTKKGFNGLFLDLVACVRSVSVGRPKTVH